MNDMLHLKIGGKHIDDNFYQFRGLVSRSSIFKELGLGSREGERLGDASKSDLLSINSFINLSISQSM